MLFIDVHCKYMLWDSQHASVRNPRYKVEWLSSSIEECRELIRLCNMWAAVVSRHLGIDGSQSLNCADDHWLASLSVCVCEAQEEGQASRPLFRDIWPLADIPAPFWSAARYRFWYLFQYLSQTLNTHQLAAWYLFLFDQQRVISSVSPKFFKYRPRLLNDISPFW